jgi:hypothetical protein
VPGAADVPGLAGRGVVDRLALAEANERALSNRSYTIWIDSYTTRVDGANETTVQRDVDVAVAGDRYRLVETRVVGELNRTRVRDVYDDGPDLYVAEGSRENATYRVLRGERSVPGSVDPWLFDQTVALRAFTTVETDVTARFERSGRTYYVVEGRGKPASVYASRVGNYTVVATVAESGLLVEGRTSYDLVTDAGFLRVAFEWEYDRIGETRVDRPAWYDDARAADAGTANRTATPTDA